MFADISEIMCSLLLATLTLNLLMQSGETKLTYIRLVAIHNSVVELYVHCTVKYTKMFLNNIVCVTSGLRIMSFVRHPIYSHKKCGAYWLL